MCGKCSLLNGKSQLRDCKRSRMNGKCSLLCCKGQFLACKACPALSGGTSIGCKSRLIPLQGKEIRRKYTYRLVRVATAALHRRGSPREVTRPTIRPNNPGRLVGPLTSAGVLFRQPPCPRHTGLRLR